MKKIISVLLVVLMLLTAVPLTEVDLGFKASALASSGTCGTNVKWSYSSSSGTLTISGTGAMSWSGSSPFRNDDNIKKVVISSGVTSIPYSAFYDCDGITSVTIADSVTSIGYDAFYSCNALASVTMGSGVTSIGNYAFQSCYALTSISIPNSVTSIGDSAFSGCSGLTSLTIGSGVTSIGSGAFSGCSGLTSLTIGSGVKTISNDAFYNCSKLTSVTIPNSVTSIGDDAFSKCSGLTSVTIGSSVTSIGDEAFSGCTKLTSFSVNSSNTYFQSVNGVLYNRNLTKLIRYPSAKTGTSYTIEKNTRSIEVGAFHDCDKLTSITISDNVTSIGYGAFSDSDGLTSVTIPDAVTSIGNYAFYSCDKLANITIGESVTSIGEYAFNSCSALTSIIIPDSVTSIGAYAFSSCSNLATVTIGSGVSSMGNYAVSAGSKLANITVDADNQYYSNDEHGVLFDKNKTTLIRYPIGNTSSSYTIPDTVKTIYVSAFDNGDNLTSVTIPDSVETIGGSTFYDCDKITSIIIPDSVTSIGTSAFRNCDKLASVTIGDGVTSIGYLAFDYCSALKSVTMGDSVSSIGYQAFRYCSNLKDLYIDDISSWVKIKFNNYSSSSYDGYLANPMYYADNLYINGQLVRNLVIPDDVTSISSFALCGGGLESIIIGSSVNTLNSYCMAYNSTLTAVVIPASVTTISSKAFYSSAYIIDLFYLGTSTEYEKISIASGNDPLSVADKHYSCTATYRDSASCTENGGVTYNCPDCKYNLILGTPAPGHSFTEEVIDEAHLKTAANCGAKAVYYYDCANCDTNAKDVKNADSYTFKHGEPTYEHVFADYKYNDDATCENNGTATAKCEGCKVTDTVVIEDTAFGHDYVSADYVAPDCINNGKTTYKCQNCDSAYDEVISATGHTEVAEPTKNPTCTENGATDGTKCSVCGEILSGCEVIDANGHVEIAFSGVDPTCTEEGMSPGTKCSVCGEILSGGESIAAIGHQETTVDEIPATCEDNGKTAGKECSVCGEVLSEREVIPATGHKFTVTETKEATCYEEGYVISTCSNCDATEKTTIANAHQFGSWKITTPASCDKEGVMTKTCSTCGEKQTKSIDRVAHTEVEVEAVAPTCTEYGYTAGIKCATCGVAIKKAEVIEAVGHNFEIIKIEPTCEANGYNYYSCSRCPETKEEEIPASGHDYIIDKEKSVESTCTENGCIYYDCSRCDSAYTETLPILRHEFDEFGDCKNCDAAHKHEFGEWSDSKAPTCKVDGYESRYCTICEFEERSPLYATGHNLVPVIYEAATCTTNGYYYESICKNCNETVKGKGEIPAFGHEWSETYKIIMAPTCCVVGQEAIACKICGEHDKDTIKTIDKIPHEWYDKAEIFKAPTCESEGVEVIRCYMCHTIQEGSETIIPKLPHTFKNGWQVMTPATCTSTGISMQICSKCFIFESRVDSMIPHADANGDYRCDMCAFDMTPEQPDTPSEPEVHVHLYKATIVKAPTCVEYGIKIYICTCGDFYNENIAALGHSDADGNGLCDVCGFGEAIKPDQPQDPSANCSCNCHKSGVMGIFWKLINIFNKLLRRNQICACGATHY